MQVLTAKLPGKQKQTPSLFNNADKEQNIQFEERA